MFEELAYSQHIRTVVHGSATLFEIPLDDILHELQELDRRDSARLPRVGYELQHFAKVILKSRGELPASLIAHARCRRSLVLSLIK